ncbi:MAG TPA: SAM-dependent methyltransferase [Beijerinckiaceae bacterium]|nr:SAM-dependent methyltransferase [Beijerinckiaceae bacterium]
MTPLAAELRRLILLEGPMPLDRYMAYCLAHPKHGYYTTRDPLGDAGDFTTAPEVSQMFGEMIGVWAMSVWAQMGRPDAFALVELGPGRGTLMADLLRASKILPGFRDAAKVHLVEISPVLMERQGHLLAGSGQAVTWVPSLARIDHGLPLIVIANEFFDALPVRQFVHCGGSWRERLVGLGQDDVLRYGLSPDPVPHMDMPGQEGDIREFCPDGQDIMRQMAERLARDGGAALAIDYGYARSQAGDSLQALRGHAFADPLEQPGEADLTTHVDFAALSAAAIAGGARAFPLLSQKTLLERLGIGLRAQKLAAAAPDRAADVASALHRLTGTGEGQMGTLFKALAIASSTLGAPPAFDSPDPVLQHLAR